MGTDDRIRIGVVGAGYWGPNLVRNFNQFPDAEVAWVCDLEEARLAHIRNLYPSLYTTQDYLEIVTDPSIDAVCVATPARCHFDMAKQALDHGKHVLVEKPFTTSSSEAEALVGLAASRDRVLLVDHTFEYAPAVRKIQEIIQKGELGQISYVHMARLNLGLFQNDINVVWDLAPHDVSILNYVLKSEPIAVAAHGNRNVLPDVEDVSMLILYYPDEIVAYVHVSWLNPRKTREATFVGSKKMLVFDDVEPLEKVRIYDKGVSEPRHYDTFGEFQLSYRYGDIYTPFIENHEPLQLECRHFLDCIKGRATPASSGEVGLRVVRVLEAADESQRLNGARVPITRP